MLDEDGERAVPFLDRSTIDYYQRLRDHAMRTSRDELQQLRTIDLMTVLLVRHEMTREEVEAMDGRALIVHGVDRGWIGREGVINLSVGEVTVSGDAATAKILVRGKPTPLRYQFRKEDGSWRLDLHAYMPVAETAFQSLIEESGEESDAFVLRLIAITSGRKADDDIWQPLDR